jgi:tRNA threonylcarbamoyladenosine biosynthesis protein TsaB
MSVRASESEKHKVKLLAVDTCLGACSVALLQDDEILAHQLVPMERGHAEALGPMVEAAMQGHNFASLVRLAVTVGPGTFTGQRVGLSFMRGLRLALGKTLTGVTSLEAMGLAAQQETHSSKAAILHDARRDEVYLALRRDAVMTMKPRVMPFEDAVAAIRTFGPCALAGTASPAAKESLSDGFALSSVRQPDALFVAKLAARMPMPGSDTSPPAPLYLRAPDAKLPGGRELVSAVAGDGDIAALAALHQAAFDKPWDTAALQTLLASPGVFAFAAASGFVLARAAADEAEILTLAVAPDARGRGLGRTLVRAAAAQALALGARTLFLEVGTGNQGALALYDGLGFARAGMRAGYYDGGDALLLKAILPLPPDLA